MQEFILLMANILLEGNNILANQGGNRRRWKY